ncbi:MAG: FkbM family methyltransferase [Flavobacteriia bacterium]|nr:FkbM family methyltransferase [Flavobacteriia bacterium]
MKTRLADGTEVHCLQKPEARMLDHHVEGYLKHGISIQDNHVVFDVGANIGIFGVRALQKAAGVNVYAFEPIPEIASVLQKNATLHGEHQMKVFQKGVSSAPGQATFTYFPNTPALSTLHPEQWDNRPGAFKEAVKSTMKNPPKSMRWMRWIPTVFAGVIAAYLVRGRKTVHCELTTLSEVIEQNALHRIDLLKIDCEGAEWDVLMGVKDADWTKIQAAVIEVHDIDGRLAKVENLMKAKGFNAIYSEQEDGLENSQMYNVFALKS